MSAGKRTFTIQGSDLGYNGGHYKSASPMAAARKAAKQLFRMIENKKKDPKLSKYHSFASHKDIKFLLRETTQGSSKDTYYYQAHVEKLKEPVEIVRGDITITITRKIVVKTCTEHLSTVGSTPKSS